MYKIDNPHSLKSLAASLEMIDFQRDNFGQKVEEQFATYIGKLNDGDYATEDLIAASPELRAIEKLTFDRIGIRMNIHNLYKTFTERVFGFFNHKTAATIPLYVNMNHVYLDLYSSDMMRDIMLRDQANFLKKLKDREGYVDEAKARVSGFYSEHENDMFFDVNYLVKTGANAAEVTAIYLHELGHVYTTMSHSARTDKTNQILSNLAKEVAKGKKIPATHIYRDLDLEAAGVSEQQFKEATTDMDQIPSALLFKSLLLKVEAQTRNNVYNQTSSEQMADGFAARFGYGRAIVTGLDKLMKYNPAIRVMSYGAPGWIFKNILEIGSVIGLFIGTPVTAAVGAGVVIGSAMDLWNRKGPGRHDAWYSFIPAILLFIVSRTSAGRAFFGIFLLLAVVAHIRATGTDTRDWTYDDFYNRYKRIRNESVASLKDLSLPPSEIQRTIADIKMIDDAMAGAFDNNKTILTYLVNFISPSASAANRDINHQRLLEELSANELFIKAAELRS